MDKQCTKFDFIKSLKKKVKSLENSDLLTFAKLMMITNYKKTDQIIYQPKINDLYDYALKNGAIGGKLVGAGGGGFLMFYTRENKLRPQ